MVRPGVFLRYVMSGIVVLVLGWIGVEELMLPDLGERLVGVGFLVVAAVEVWLAWSRIRVAIGRDPMMIRNPVRTYVVSLRDIERMEPQYEGRRIWTAGGREIVAVAVERHKIATWLGRRSKAYDVVDLIERKRAASLQSGRGLVE